MKLFGLQITPDSEYQALKETLTDIERQLEDIGWVSINNKESNSQEMAKESYEQMVKRSRLAYIKSPLVAQAVNLTTAYTFGAGIQEPKASEENPEVQELIKKFWNAPDNKLSFTSSESQIKLSNKLQYDGEIAFVLQVDTDGSVYVRLIDPLSILSVVYDSTDSMRPLYYKRKIKGSIEKFEYIPDIGNGIEVLRDTNDSFLTQYAEKLAAWGIPPTEVKKNCFVFHVKVNNDILDTRGVPEVWRALDWVNSNSKIAGDMASFINAQSQYAWTKKVKGTKAQIQAMRGRLGQNTNLTNPSYQAGSTIIENDLVENKPIALPGSSSGVFEGGIRRTLLMVCASFGIMEHYFGDPSTGNLATATAMELPMLKKFLAKQKLWESIFDTILQFQLDMHIIHTSTGAAEYHEINNRYTVKESADFDDRHIDIDFPPIIEKDLNTTAQALSLAKKEGLMPIETAQRMFLVAAGVNNIEEEMQMAFQEPSALFTPPNSLPAQERAYRPHLNPKNGHLKETIRQEDGKWVVYSKNGRKIGGPYDTEAKAKERLKQIETFKNKESVASTDIRSGKEKAVKLADKNKTVLTQMNAYLKEIAKAYRKFNKKIVDNSKVTHGTEGKFRPEVKELDEVVREFKDDMLALGEKFLPKAVDLGEKYVMSHSLKESTTITEASKEKLKRFKEQQLLWNAQYVTTSLIPAIKKKFHDVAFSEHETVETAKKKLVDTVKTFESRVASYAAAFWTVEERSVKLVAEDENLTANFIGVDDADNCEDCQAAIEGNPWPVNEIPVPGEQQCLGSCRHAIQLIGDEALTESDIKILKEAENEFKRGMKILEDE